MRLSFSTLGCPGWSFEQIMENAHEMGYEAVELRGVGISFAWRSWSACSRKTAARLNVCWRKIR